MSEGRIILHIDIRNYTTSALRHQVGKRVFSAAIDLLLLFGRITGSVVKYEKS